MEQYEIDDMMTNLQNYLERQNINTSKFFRCINPQHHDSNASMKLFDDHKAYCFGCGANYDLIATIGIFEGLNRSEAFKKAKEYYYSNFKNIPKKSQIKAKEKSVEKDYKKAYYVWQKNLKNCKEAKDYLKKRGINEATIRKFGIGFNDFDFGDMRFKSVIIPISDSCFTARNIMANEELRYYKPRGSKIEMLNIGSLTNKDKYCIVTEGEFDCLSFATLGLNSMALSSANNINKFINAEKDNTKLYVLALDNDEAGKIAEQSLIDYFEENKIKYVVFDNCGYKDANIALIENRKEFEKNIYKLLENNKIKLKEAEM